MQQRCRAIFMTTTRKLALRGRIGRNSRPLLLAGRAAYRADDMGFTYPLMRGPASLIRRRLQRRTARGYAELGLLAGLILICAGVLGFALAYRHPEAGSGSPSSSRSPKPRDRRR
jgi:hypothetical protein